jgi:alkylation response protein AidB-like acyl-CoA dehydrogenase
MWPSGRGRDVPRHELFKKLGNLGLLGLKYPESSAARDWISATRW